MSYTKGPWIADLYEDGCFVIRPHGEEGPIIAERGVWTDSPSHANARLIAAAPDLLEACKVALYGGGTIAEAAEIVRSAIAKAEGR